MSIARALVVVALVVGAGAARAQVAVATSITDNDAAQRQIAASVVTMATQRWDVLRPPLSVAELSRCARGDTACLRKLAASRGAAHLLVVGAGPLGVRDHVVAVQLFAVGSDKPLFEESAVQAGDAGGASTGLSEVNQIARRLVQTVGPAAAKPETPTSPPVVEEDTGLLTWIGVSAMVGGTVVGLGTGAVTGLIASSDRDFGSIDDSLWISSLVAAGCVAVGATLVVADLL